MLIVSCDLVTDMALHLLADVHRTHDASVTMMMAPAPDVTEMSAPGGKSSKRIGKDRTVIHSLCVRLVELASSECV